MICPYNRIMTHTTQTFMEAATKSRLTPEQVVFVVRHFQALYTWHLALVDGTYRLTVPEIGEISALVRKVGTAYERVTKGFATSRGRTREESIMAALNELEAIVERKTTKRRAS